MSFRRRCSHVLAGSAWLMSLVGPSLALGQERATLPRSAPAVAKSEKAAIPDISLTREGELVGMLVDQQAKPIANAVVQLKQGRDTIAQAKTDAQGVFRVEAARGGVYQLVTEKENVAVRLWTKNSAPPAAKSLAVVMRAPTVVRAQDGDEGLLGAVDLGTAALLGLGIATITVTSVNLDRTTDIKRSLGAQTSTLSQQNTQLNQQVSNLAQQNTQLNQQIASLQQRLDQLARSLNAP